MKSEVNPYSISHCYHHNNNNPLIDTSFLVQRSLQDSDIQHSILALIPVHIPEIPDIKTGHSGNAFNVFRITTGNPRLYFGDYISTIRVRLRISSLMSIFYTPLLFIPLPRWCFSECLHFLNAYQEFIRWGFLRHRV